jgi:hypothetical protein
MLLGAERVVDAEVKRNRAPEVAPREDACPQATLGGEEGDDDTQHLVEEAANEVEACRVPLPIWLDPPLLVGVHLTTQ